MIIQAIKLTGMPVEDTRFAQAVDTATYSVLHAFRYLPLPDDEIDMERLVDRLDDMIINIMMAFLT